MCYVFSGHLGDVAAIQLRAGPFVSCKDWDVSSFHALVISIDNIFCPFRNKSRLTFTRFLELTLFKFWETYANVRTRPLF